MHMSSNQSLIKVSITPGVLLSWLVLSVEPSLPYLFQKGKLMDQKSGINNDGTLAMHSEVADL